MSWDYYMELLKELRASIDNWHADYEGVDAQSVLLDMEDIIAKHELRLDI